MQISSILFYDSQCGLCQRSVRFFLFIDKKKSVAFAPLFGKKYQELIPVNFKNYDSILFYQNGEICIKSKAILEGISSLGGAYKLVWIAKIIPRFFLDFLYDQVAINRKKILCDLDFISKNNNDERFYE